MAKTPTPTVRKSNSIAKQRLKSFSVGNGGLRIKLRGSANRTKVFFAPTDAVAFRALVSSAILAHSSGEEITIQYPIVASLAGQAQTKTILAIG